MKKYIIWMVLCVILFSSCIMSEDEGISSEDKVTSNTESVEQSTVIAGEEKAETIEKQTQVFYKEGLYFEALEKFYLHVNNNDVVNIIASKYYTNDENGEIALFYDEGEYVGDIGDTTERYLVNGLQIFQEPFVIEESDGATGHRASIIYMRDEREVDENGEYIINDHGDIKSFMKICIATMAYDPNNKVWKVLEVGEMATFMIDGRINDDWQKYIGVNDENGGWIGNYGEWYEENIYKGNE